jgi:hypothetical protein
MAARPGRFFVGWALGVLTALISLAVSGGWYEYRWLAQAECAERKAGAINTGGFEVVPNQSDPCYLRRPNVRPAQWGDGIPWAIRRLQGQ